MFTKQLKKYQSVIIGLCIFFVMVFGASLFSFGIFGNQHHAIYTMSNWFNHHKYTVLLWHILLIAAIYWGWGLKISLAAKRDQMDDLRIKKLKRVRWYLIILFVLISFSVYL